MPLVQNLINSPLIKKELPDAIGKMMGALLRSFGEMFLGIGSAIQGEENLLKTILDNVLQGFYSAFGGGDVGKENFNKMIGDLSQMFSKLAGDALEAAMEIAIPVLGNAIKGIVSTVWDKGGPLGKFLVLAIPAALTKLVFSLTGLTASATAAAGALKWVAANGGMGGVATGWR